MRYFIVFGLLLLLTGCSQQKPVPEEIPLTKKPAGIETLKYKTDPQTQVVGLDAPSEISEIVPATTEVVKGADAVVEKKVPVAKTPEEIEAEAAAAKAKAVQRQKALEAKKKSVATTSKETKKVKDSKTIIGAVELIRLIPSDLVRKARIDTGATTTSIDAADVQPFERDGERWVSFRMGGVEDAPVIKKPVSRIVQIKRHGEESQDRFVVKMRLILGERSQVVEVSLTDRSKFTYPILIGRNFLRDYYIVDVGAKLTSKPVEYEKR